MSYGPSEFVDDIDSHLQDAGYTFQDEDGEDFGEYDGWRFQPVARPERSNDDMGDCNRTIESAAADFFERVAALKTAAAKLIKANDDVGHTDRFHKALHALQDALDDLTPRARP